MNETIRKIWDERPQDIHLEVYGQQGPSADAGVEAWGRRLALAVLQATPTPDSTDHGALDYRDELQRIIEGLGRATKEERRIGYWGRDTMPCAVALCGVLHLEATPSSFVALCNGQRFEYCMQPSRILEDAGMRISTLRICKRCEKKQREEKR